MELQWGATSALVGLCPTTYFRPLNGFEDCTAPRFILQGTSAYSFNSLLITLPFVKAAGVPVASQDVAGLLTISSRASMVNGQR